ncbi:MAG: GNAT family N-acetyltransferase [Halanaeroarchaeum sp.]
MPGPAFIVGDEVALHTIEEEDVPFLQESINHPEVRRYLANSQPYNGVQEREWFEEVVSGGEGVNLLVVADDDPVGTVGLGAQPQQESSAEIGLHVARPHWNEGYGTAASRLLTDYAFRERRFHRVVARAYDPNEGSKRIWEKLGYRHEAVHKEAAFVEGEYVDVHRYAVLEHEWRD